MARWMIGALVATILVAVTSPLFVRSYLPRQIDSVRDVTILSPNHDYRWRSEGYADTWIGPHGMPGKQSIAILPHAPSRHRVALWGDSQAEGVGVADHLKIFAQCEELAGQASMRLDVLPFARSGDDASRWLWQWPSVEAEFKIDAHAILIVDLDDLAAATTPFEPEHPDETQQTLARVLPSMAIHAARNLLTGDDAITPRQLRFGIGPTIVEPSKKSIDTVETHRQSDPSWTRVGEAIRRRSRLPVIVIYAPPVPSIMNGRIIEQDADTPDLAPLVDALNSFDIQWVDVRRELAESARRNHWPRGFHHGQIGVGHLNGQGNRIVAEAIVKSVRKLGLHD